LHQLSSIHAIGLFGTFQQISKKVGHELARGPISGHPLRPKHMFSSFCVTVYLKNKSYLE